MRLLLLCAVTLACACGGDTYRWYCDELNTSESTWDLTSGTCGDSSLRADLRTPQPVLGCTCTVAPWTYVREESTYATSERCTSSARCSCPSGAASLALTTVGPAFTVEASGLPCGVYVGTPEQR